MSVEPSSDLLKLGKQDYEAVAEKKESLFKPGIVNKHEVEEVRDTNNSHSIKGAV